MEENQKSIDGVIEKLALIADGIETLFPESKTAIAIELEKDEFKKQFRFVLQGYCLRPIEFTAALAHERLKEWNKTFKIRERNKLRFIDRRFFFFNVFLDVLN